MSDWLDESQMRLEVLAEEVEMLSQRMGSNLATLEHFRRSLEGRLCDLVDDPLRIPAHTGSTLRDLARDIQRGEKLAKQNSADWKKVREAFERESEMMLILRRRYDPNGPVS